MLVKGVAPGLVLLVIAFWLGSGCRKDSPGPDVPDTLGLVNQIPDAGFEAWLPVNQGAVSYWEPSSGWWGSLNKLALIGGPVTCLPDSDGVDGTLCLRLESKAWGSMIIPGLLAAGFFDTSAPIGENMIQGRPFVLRPLRIQAQVRYLSVENDSAAVSVILTRWDTIQNQRDTIGEANWTTQASTTGFIPLQIPFQYRSAQYPDSIRCVLISSLDGNHFKGSVGSTLWVDNLSLVFP